MKLLRNLSPKYKNGYRISYAVFWCSSCSKTYHFNDTRLVSDIVDLIKDME